MDSGALPSYFEQQEICGNLTSSQVRVVLKSWENIIQLFLEHSFRFKRPQCAFQSLSQFSTSSTWYTQWWDQTWAKMSLT